MTPPAPSADAQVGIERAAFLADKLERFAAYAECVNDDPPAISVAEAREIVSLLRQVRDGRLVPATKGEIENGTDC